LKCAIPTVLPVSKPALSQDSWQDGVPFVQVIELFLQSSCLQDNRSESMKKTTNNKENKNPTKKDTILKNYPFI